MINLSSSYNPDVLSCIANLSNDEVFTPPEIANAMLDMLPQELFSDPNATFLDPATKSGVFLREISKRLIVGLEPTFPDLQERLDHIFHKQVFGIAITELTSLLSRRSLYCSKYPNSIYSVSTFDDIQGNIRFRNIMHRWKDGKCVYCGAAESEYGDKKRQDLEKHAYEFIHNMNPKEIFNMKFDVIIGNPPYQLNDGGGNGASAKPIYQLFVQMAKKLNPKYVAMITPSRWFTGGKGLDDYRDEMLKDNRIRIIHDFPETGDCFEGVSIKGGVSYFLWDRDNPGLCEVYSHKGSSVSGPCVRPLLEEGADTFIRYNDAISILHKIKKFNEDSFEEMVSYRMPFGFPNTFKGNKRKEKSTDLLIYVSGNDREIRGTAAYVDVKQVTKGKEMIPWEKVYISKAGSGSDVFPHSILTKPFYGAPNTVCNESYLVIGPFKDETECKNVMSYISTRFFRFLVLLKKNSQNAPRSVYQYVPIQDFSKPWTDEELYEKYGITEEEIGFIETMIKPMDLAGDENDG